MKVQFTPQVSLLNYKRVQQPLKDSNKQQVTQNSYNPIAYKDYNISFGERLFRTPENFYAQRFNEKNMPQTLHKYIYEDIDSNFRKTIPPAQAMQQVFGRIKFAKDLDAVKLMYPDEPLFKDLSSKPNKKSREGLLGMINLMQSDPSYKDKTLFKNGNNDLGMYILKKIYVEGKTLKEINKDFAKDVSVHFKSYDIKPQDYNAFGIKFPHNSFWKSFTATREDFPYVYIPRQNSPHTINNAERSSAQKTAKPSKFKDVPDWKIDKLSDILIQSGGDNEKAQKLLRKKNVNDNESENFVVKYMSPIMCIALDKINASEEMRYFWGNSGKGKTNREIVNAYWNTTEMRELQSMAMKDTIKLFMELYGVDGDNDEFKELLDYAKSIPDTRAQRDALHNKIQKEYDEMFANLTSEELKVLQTQETVGHPNASESSKTAETPLTLEETLKAEAKKNNASVYEFKLKNGTKISLVIDLKKMLSDKINSNMYYYPTSYRDNFKNFIWSKKEPKEIFSILFDKDDLKGFNIKMWGGGNDDKDRGTIYDMFVSENLLLKDAAEKKKQKLEKEFLRKNEVSDKAAKQAMLEIVFDTDELNVKEILHSGGVSFEEFSDEDINNPENSDRLYKTVEEFIQSFKGNKKAFLSTGDTNECLKLAYLSRSDEHIMERIDERYKVYNRKLSSGEIYRIAKKLPKYIMNYNEKTAACNDVQTSAIFKTIAANLRKDPELAEELSKSILAYDMLKSEMSDYRAFILNDVSDKVLNAKAEEFFTNLFNEHGTLLLSLLAVNKYTIDTIIKPVDRELYNELMKYRMINTVNYMIKNK